MSEFDRIAGYSDEKRELNDICKLFRRFDKLSDAGFRLPRGNPFSGSARSRQNRYGGSLYKRIRRILRANKF